MPVKINTQKLTDAAYTLVYDQYARINDASHTQLPVEEMVINGERFRLSVTLERLPQPATDRNPGDAQERIRELRHLFN